MSRGVPRKFGGQGSNLKIRAQRCISFKDTFVSKTKFYDEATGHIFF